MKKHSTRDLVDLSQTPLTSNARNTLHRLIAHANPVSLHEEDERDIRFAVDFLKNIENHYLDADKPRNSVYTEKAQRELQPQAHRFAHLLNKDKSQAPSARSEIISPVEDRYALGFALDVLAKFDNSVKPEDVAGLKEELGIPPNRIHSEGHLGQKIRESLQTTPTRGHGHDGFMMG